MKLHFVVAGFSKCGTTTLCSMMAEHPKLFMPTRFKEPRFFDKKDYSLHWDWYQSLFYTAPADALLGEGSVSFAEAEFADLSLKRLVKHFPKVKIILIARDPMDRIESSYREMHNSGTDWGVHCPYNIEDALVKFPNMLRDTMYKEIFETFKKYLPLQQILVLFLEDLKANEKEVLDQCFNFLGVPFMSTVGIKKKHLNEGTKKYYDTPKLRELKFNPNSGMADHNIPAKVLNQFMPQLNLRKPFGKEKLEWSPKACKLLVDALGGGPEIFLNQFQKDISFWPRYASLLNES